MKHWYCPNCHRDKTTEDNIILSLCSCGEYMKEVKKDEKRGEE